MSQGKPRRPQAISKNPSYGNVFNVSEDLAKKPIAPEDASMMQTAESTVFGQTQKGGPVAVMQCQNERAGFVGHRDVNDIAGEQGVTVSETDLPGRRIITESVAGQVVGQYMQPTPVTRTIVIGAADQSAITTGEAPEAIAQTAGNKRVDQSDAAAIQAAEVRAIGSTVIIPGGLAASGQSAAAHNATVHREEAKVKINEVLAIIV